MATKRKTKSAKAAKAAKSEAVVKAAPTPKPRQITLDTFRRTSGIRPEHFGGFARYITLEYGSDATHWKTVADWNITYDKYLKRPVVG